MEQTLIMISLWCGFGYQHEGYSTVSTLSINNVCRKSFVECVDAIKDRPNVSKDAQIFECAKKASPL